MSLRFCALLLVAAAVLTGCSTPSVHPIYSKDKEATDPALVGVWRPDENDTHETYTVTREGDAYRMVFKDDKSADPHPFEVHLVQLGKYRFADVSAADSDQSKTSDQWGPFFVPTHMFLRYNVDGDRLRIWTLDREEFEKDIAAKKFDLAHTRLSKDTLLITAETADLQAFLEKHAEHPDLFHSADLVRVKH